MRALRSGGTLIRVARRSWLVGLAGWRRCLSKPSSVLGGVGSVSVLTCCLLCCPIWVLRGLRSSLAFVGSVLRWALRVLPGRSRSARDCGFCGPGRRIWCCAGAARSRCFRLSRTRSAMLGRWRVVGPTLRRRVGRLTGGAMGWCLARVPAWLCWSGLSLRGPEVRVFMAGYSVGVRAPMGTIPLRRVLMVRVRPTLCGWLCVTPVRSPMTSGISARTAPVLRRAMRRRLRLC